MNKYFEDNLRYLKNDEKHLCQESEENNLDIFLRYLDIFLKMTTILLQKLAEVLNEVMFRKGKRIGNI